MSPVTFKKGREGGGGTTNQDDEECAALCMGKRYIKISLIGVLL